MTTTHILPRGLGMSLTGGLDNHGTGQRLSVFVHRGDFTMESADDMGTRPTTSARSTERPGEME